LQKFIEPKNNKNCKIKKKNSKENFIFFIIALIKVSWSPQFCLLYRKTNIYDLTNNRVSLYDKLVTFEGPEHLTLSGKNKKKKII